MLDDPFSAFYCALLRFHLRLNFHVSVVLSLSLIQTQTERFHASLSAVLRSGLYLVPRFSVLFFVLSQRISHYVFLMFCLLYRVTHGLILHFPHSFLVIPIADSY